MLTDDNISNEEFFPTCGYYLLEAPQDYERPLFKKRSKFEIVLHILLSPIYIVGFLVYGVFAVVNFLTEGGLFGLLIIGWILSFIYHFLFTFLPFLVNLVA